MSARSIARRLPAGLGPRRLVLLPVLRGVHSRAAALALLPVALRALPLGPLPTPSAPVDGPWMRTLAPAALLPPRVATIPRA